MNHVMPAQQRLTTSFQTPQEVFKTASFTCENLSPERPARCGACTPWAAVYDGPVCAKAPHNTARTALLHATRRTANGPMRQTNQAQAEPQAGRECPSDAFINVRGRTFYCSTANGNTGKNHASRFYRPFRAYRRA